VGKQRQGTGLAYAAGRRNSTEMKRIISQCIQSADWRRQASCVLGVALLAAVTVYGRIIVAKTPQAVRMVVYAFSTQEEVLSQGIFPAFEEAWEAETGRDLIIEGVFGASETLAGQINLGAPADVAVFSNAQQVRWLKVGRRVRQDSEAVSIGCTPMIVITRPGNPFGLAEFADLSQPGLRVLHADPRSSGGGQWAVLAEYGSAWRWSGDRAAGEAQLDAIWRNVRLLGPSARAAMTMFELGAGDALVTYEQDAYLAMERGVALEIEVPPRTIIAQHEAVIVDDNVTSRERPVVEAFMRYLLSDAGQQILGEYHLRPADCDSEQFPRLEQPFTVEDLGGWPSAYTEVIEAQWKAEIEPRLDLKPGPRLLGPGE
jgi:ABC-type sulfate transport system substrate-binding protein